MFNLGRYLWSINPHALVTPKALRSTQIDSQFADDIFQMHIIEWKYEFQLQFHWNLFLAV